jgi:hypothetical protein
MFAKGTLLKVRTRTVGDVFGEVVWEIVETGLPAPEPHRRGISDGVRCVMLGGTGPSARKGYPVVDSEDTIRRNIAEGITEVVPPEKRQAMIDYYNAQDGKPKRVGSGIEV